jgi:hypothetical protein
MYRAPNKSNEINGLEKFSKPFFFARMKKIRKTSEHSCVLGRTRMDRGRNFFHTRHELTAGQLIGIFSLPLFR